METVYEVLHMALEAARKREGYSGTIDDFKVALASRNWEDRDPIIEEMLSDIRATSYEPLRLWHAEHWGVKDTILQKWKEPLELLDLLVVLAERFGTAFYGERVATGIDADEFLLLTELTQLHARACQISSAIHLLLRSGYPDDAHARWRSLHEISVIAKFLKEGGPLLAERYSEHKTVQQHKQVLADHEQIHQLGREPEPKQIDYLNSLQAKVDALVDRYGSSFKREYGWAAEAIGKTRTTFRDIEKKVSINETVNMEGWRSQFRLASENVHASSQGSAYRLGLGKDSDAVILSGPSTEGLGDPGFTTANSLCETALALLGTRSNADDVLRVGILINLAERTSNAFLTTLDGD